MQKNHTIATSNQSLKNCKLDGTLAHWPASKLACHSFMGIGKRLLDQRQRTILLLLAVTIARGSDLHHTLPQYPQGHMKRVR